MNIRNMLFENADLKYKEFHSKLMPTVAPDNVIGVRIPVLRKIAKEFEKDSHCPLFLSSLPHKYYEENNLHAFIIAGIKDYDKCIDEVNRFLPYIDNWATCDSLRPRCFEKNTDKLIEEIYRWIISDHTYTARFGIEMLMVFYLEEKFDEKYLHLISRIKSDEYYVNMMIAWYFATALAKQWECTISYLENGILSPWLHNKTIQKAIESHRITDGQKAYLRNLRNRNRETRVLYEHI